MRDRRRAARGLGPRFEMLYARMQNPAVREATERALRGRRGDTAGGAVTDAEVLARVYEILSVRHCESIAYRRRSPAHTPADVHRRYWRERLALESLGVVMTIAELLASEHALVREATLLALSE